jgi:hypothetical protein
MSVNAYGGASTIPVDDSLSGIAIRGGEGAAPGGFNAINPFYSIGGHGGASAFAGGAAGGWSSDGHSALPNTGGGGGGCGTFGDTNSEGKMSGPGGGAGGFLEVTITSPTNSYSYSVGLGGQPGVNPATTPGSGGAGGSGFIKVVAHFQ